MNFEEFRELLRANSSEDLARRFLQATSVAVFASSLDYEGFQNRVRERIPAVDIFAIVGSGNWQFSLNPEKLFRPFGLHSDIDVAIISYERYNALWDEMRVLHRKRFYRLSHEERTRLRRNGENVYAGFISRSGTEASGTLPVRHPSTDDSRSLWPKFWRAVDLGLRCEKARFKGQGQERHRLCRGMRYLSPPGDTGACERVGAEQGREGVLEVEVQHSMATSTTEVAHAHASIPIEKPAPLRAELPTIAGAQI